MQCWELNLFILVTAFTCNMHWHDIVCCNVVFQLVQPSSKWLSTRSSFQQSQTTSSFSSSQPYHRLVQCQGDQQRKQQDGLMDKGDNTGQGRAGQVNASRWGVLSTSSYLWLQLLYHLVNMDGRSKEGGSGCSNVNNNLDKVCILMYFIYINLRFTYSYLYIYEISYDYYCF